MNGQLRFKTHFESYKDFTSSDEIKSLKLSTRPVLDLLIDMAQITDANPHGAYLLDTREWKKDLNIKLKDLKKAFTDLKKNHVCFTTQEINGERIVRHQYLVIFYDHRLWLGENSEKTIEEKKEKAKDLLDSDKLNKENDEKIQAIWKRHFPDYVKVLRSSYDTEISKDLKKDGEVEVSIPDWSTWDPFETLFFNTALKDRAFLKELNDEGLLDAIPVAKATYNKILRDIPVSGEEIQLAVNQAHRGSRKKLTVEERRPELLMEFHRLFPSMALGKLWEHVLEFEKGNYDKLIEMIGGRLSVIPELKAQRTNSRGLKPHTAKTLEDEAKASSPDKDKSKKQKEKKPSGREWNAVIDWGVVPDQKKDTNKITNTEVASTTVYDGEKETKKESYIKPVEEQKTTTKKKGLGWNDVKDLYDLLGAGLSPTIPTPKEDTDFPKMLTYPFSLIYRARDKEDFIKWTKLEPTEIDKEMIELTVNTFAKDALVQLTKMDRLDLINQYRSDKDFLAKLFKIMTYFGADIKNHSDEDLIGWVNTFDQYDWSNPLDGSPKFRFKP